MSPDDRLQPSAAERRRVARAVLVGALFGAGGGIALVALLRALLGMPENFVPKAAGVVLIVAAFGAFVAVLVSARQPRRKAG